MCTLTFLPHYDGYELWFNRDEQRQRALAVPPAVNSPLAAIYPVDPQGQGTWLAVKQSGMSLALLNNYQAQQHHGLAKPRSRGQLIIELLSQSYVDMALLTQLDLSRYRPFVLAIFPANLCLSHAQILLVGWDGVRLSTLDPVLPITSSSVDIVAVISQRQQKYARLIDHKAPTSHQFKRFHFSKVEQGRQSVNMSREDAHTVSISHIKVDSHVVHFDYFDNVTKARTATLMTRYPG